MTGEDQRVEIAGIEHSRLELERQQPQPGGRDPAPGELVLLQSFLNTHFDLVSDWGTDLLAGPGHLLAWFSGRGLVSDRTRLPSHAQVHQVITMREGLRDLARCNRDLDVEPDPVALAGLNEAAAGVSLRLAFSSERVVLSPRGDGALDGAMAVLLSVALQAMVDGRWRRLKTCPGEQCGWVFYDHSRNNSGRWCSMAVCGGRTKAKSHYRRQRLRAASEG